jgi:hypothetical protein
MVSIPQIRTRLLEGFPEMQADLLAHVLIESHDDLVNRADFHELTCVVKDLAESQRDLADAQKDLAVAQKRTEGKMEELVVAQQRTEVRMEELADAQKRTEGKMEELTVAQKRTDVRMEELAVAQQRTEVRMEELAVAQQRTEVKMGELAEGQERLVESQHRTDGILVELTSTQQKMLTRLDRLDGHMLEDHVTRNLPAFLGREFRKCRVLERSDFVESLEALLPEDDLADLMRADTIATATRAGKKFHLVVEASCTADSNDLDRAARRAAALAKAGFTAIGIVACEVISPQTLAEARRRGLRVLAGGWLLPEAA